MSIATVVPARVVQPFNLVRRQTQPQTALVARLTATAVAAYLVACVLPMTSARPTLAPLTALLVLQVTLYRTVRMAVQRIGSVVGGVLIAVLLANVVGFTWWTLGLVIAAALMLGFALRLGDQVLEVAISAMLILSLPSNFNAADRVVETLIGAGTGLIAGLILSPLRVQPAEEAVQDLSRRMAELLDRMAMGLRGEPSRDQACDWLRRSRELGREIGRVRRALEDAEDSIKLNPRAVGLVHAGVVLSTGLESLEHFQVYLRGLARAVVDGMRAGDPVYGRHGHEVLAAALDDLADAIRAYGHMVRSEVAGDPDYAEKELQRALTAAGRHRDDVAGILQNLPVDDAVEWALRGALLVHLDQLINQLRVEHRARQRERWPRRRPSRRRRPTDRRPGDRQPRERRLGDRETGKRRLGDREAGERRLGDREAGERRTGDRQAGERRLGDRDRRSGDREAGKRCLSA
ncbi:aromatic acid exporter family protein [Actinoallomurus acanthiterrae]